MPRIPELNDIVLTFDAAETPDLADVEVRCKSVSLKKAREIDSWGAEPGGFERINEYFVREIIQSWNLEDGSGNVLPVTMESVETGPPWMLVQMRNAWNVGLLTPPKA